MEKIAEIINHYYDQIQGRVEKILTDTKNSDNFRPSQNIEAFQKWSSELRGSNTERAIKYFAGLSTFFDAGALLLEEQGRGLVQHLFYNGELHPASDKVLQSIPLPQLEALQIKKRKGDEIYQELFRKEGSDIEALLIGTPTPFVYLTFSKLPHPWLKDRAEHLQSCLANTFQVIE